MIELIVLFAIIFIAVLVLPKYIKSYCSRCVDMAYNDEKAQKILKKQGIGDIRRKGGKKK